MDWAILGHGPSLLFFFFDIFKELYVIPKSQQTKILAYWPTLLSRAKLWDNYYVETSVTVR